MCRLGPDAISVQTGAFRRPSRRWSKSPAGLHPRAHPPPTARPLVLRSRRTLRTRDHRTSAPSMFPALRSQEDRNPGVQRFPQDGRFTRLLPVPKPVTAYGQDCMRRPPHRAPVCHTPSLQNHSVSAHFRPLRSPQANH